MKYALVYEFDSESTEHLKNIMREVAKVTGNDFMIKENIPPHITIGCFETESEALFINMIECGLKDIRSNTITLSSIGVFKPSVVYIAPTLNQFLQESCECFFDYCHEIATPSDENHYVPHQWVPHIAITITNENIIQGIEKCIEMFEPCDITVEKLTLVRCDPYTEIKTYSLSKCS